MQLLLHITETAGYVFVEVHCQACAVQVKLLPIICDNGGNISVILV